MPKFETLTIATASTSFASNGRTEFSESVTRYTNAGNGLVLRASDLSAYEMAYGSTYSLSYKGLVDLKLQEVPLRTPVARPVVEIKNALRFDALPSEPGREFVVEYSTGLDNQSANFLPIMLACKSTRKLPASSLHATIAGEALELECRLSNNGAVQSGSKWMLLLAYGVAVEVEHVRSTNRVTTRIVEFSVKS